MFIVPCTTVADKGKRAAKAKRCIHINDAEPKTPKTHATTKCCKHRNNANTQNTCNREVLHIESAQWICPHNGSVK